VQATELVFERDVETPVQDHVDQEQYAVL